MCVRLAAEGPPLMKLLQMGKMGSSTTKFLLPDLEDLGTRLGVFYRCLSEVVLPFTTACCFTYTLAGYSAQRTLNMVRRTIASMSCPASSG